AQCAACPPSARAARLPRTTHTSAPPRARAMASRRPHRARAMSGPSRSDLVDLVLLDAREDPVELARRDLRVAVAADARHVDLVDRRAAARACGVCAARARAARSADERPVLGVLARLA